MHTTVAADHNLVHVTNMSTHDNPIILNQLLSYTIIIESMDSISRDCMDTPIIYVIH